MWLPKSAVRSTCILPVTHGQGSTSVGKFVVPGGFLQGEKAVAVLHLFVRFEL
jgi:hypothetical protein